MKTKLAVLLTFAASYSAYALPLGNPAEPGFLSNGLLFEGYCYNFCEPGASWCDALSIRIGYYGDFVFNRHVEVDTNDFDSDIECTEIYTNAGYIALNFWNRVDFFATLGASNLFIDTSSKSFQTFEVELGNAVRFEIESETDFSWSVGIRAILLEWCCYTLGIEAQYFSMQPEIRRITAQMDTSIYPDPILDLKYREWQIGFGIARRIWNFVPYIGIKFSKAQIDFDNAQTSVADISFVSSSILFDLKSKHFFGYAFGVSLIDCEKAAVTVEARFPDEKAIYVNGQIRF